jgi:hypothetical protein
MTDETAIATVEAMSPSASSNNKVGASEGLTSVQLFQKHLLELTDTRETLKDDNRSVSLYYLALLRRMYNPFITYPMPRHQLLAKYIMLWSVLERPELQQYGIEATLGLRYLVSGHFGTSQAILEEIEFKTSTSAAMSCVMRGVTQFLRVMVFVSLTFVAILAFSGKKNIFYLIL